MELILVNEIAESFYRNLHKFFVDIRCVRLQRFFFFSVSFSPHLDFLFDPRNFYLQIFQTWPKR